MTKKARILNISPKAQLDITDNNSSGYPSILRTGDERTLGNNSSIFDESKIQIFSRQAVVMPYNTSKSCTSTAGFLTGSISISKVPTPASQFLTTYNDESYEPYSESRNPSSFFPSGSGRLKGFDETIYQGFTSPISSKIAIPIDISLASDPLAPADLDIKIQGTSPTATTSPFVYYNFSTKTWDQIGTSDPSTGIPYDYYHLMDVTPETSIPNTWLRGKENKYPIVKQFTSSPGIGMSLGPTPGELVAHGYDKIGYPTSFFDAPNHLRYHAKDAQTLKMSNYITSPFILEKIQVKIPVRGTRTHNGDTKAPTFISGSGRDIDNHVFFIYRQNRVEQLTDSPADVSSSIRALIGNESFCFYNRRSMPFNGVTFSTPIHEYGFITNFGVLTSTTGTFVTPNFNLDLVFIPKTYEQQYTAPSTLGVNVSVGNSFTNGYIQNYWDGGQRSIKNEVSSIRVFPTLPEAIRSVQVRGNNQFLYTTTSNPNFPNRTFDFDPRTMRSSTSFTSVREPIAPLPGTRYFDVDVASRDLGYRENLYVLFPEDELVFGIDAGLYPTYKQQVVTGLSTNDLPPGYFDEVDNITQVGDPTKDTTSKLTILKGSATVILYGTLIKDGVEMLSSVNQNLTSPAIHEDIHQTISDQFQISETSLYAGTYIGNRVSGLMSTGFAPRGRTGTLTGTQARAVELTNFPFISDNSKTSTGVLSSKLTPKLLSSKFRYDKFGQFRDMLEQRIDTKGTETRFTAKNLPLPDFFKTFGTTQVLAPVIVSFVSQSSTTTVAPSNTRSGNLSTEATASFPYYEDGTIRNRGEIVFGENPPFTVDTIILDKGSTLLTTT